jgi:hypothetical protein
MAVITNIVLQSEANLGSTTGSITYTNVKFDSSVANSIAASITYTNVKFDSSVANSIAASITYTNVKFDSSVANSILGDKTQITVGVPRIYRAYAENWPSI